MAVNNNDEHSSFTDLKANVLESNEERPRNFASLRWKLTLPVVAVVIDIAMITTYAGTDCIARGLRDSQVNQLLISARAANERAAALGDSQRREAERVAFTQNVPELVAAQNGPTLQTLVEPLAAAADLDYLFIGAGNGRELVGIQRTSTDKPYVATEEPFLTNLAFTTSMLSAENPSAP